MVFFYRHCEAVTNSDKSHKYPWYCTLTFLEQKDMLKLYYSGGTEVANEYTKIVTAHLVWMNLGIINNDNTEGI